MMQEDRNGGYRCPRCGSLPVSDLRTWTYVYSEHVGLEGYEEIVERHICPVCVFEGALDENPMMWLI